MRCGPLGIVLSPTRFGHKVKEYPTRRNVHELQTREFACAQFSVVGKHSKHSEPK